MKTLLIYKSQTGFTRRYAEIIAAQTGCDLMEFKKASAKLLSGYNRIVFGGRLRAGAVDGLKAAKAMFKKSGAKEFIVFATGATPNAAADIITQTWMKNLSEAELASIPHFYMQSGLQYDGMSGIDRFMMRMLSRMLAKKKDLSETDAAFARAIASSYDISSEEYARPLIDYLNG